MAPVSRSAAAQPAARSIELEFFRLLNRIVEPRVRAGWGSPRLAPGGFVVLEAKGRSTGKTFRTPLAALRFRDHVVVSTYRGRRSGWVKNVAANPDVRYWIGGKPKTARARLISADHPVEDPAGLPAPLRLLVASLVPYTYAGWAFALLEPTKRAPKSGGGPMGRRSRSS